MCGHRPRKEMSSGSPVTNLASTGSSRTHWALSRGKANRGRQEGKGQSPSSRQSKMGVTSPILTRNGSLEKKAILKGMQLVPGEPAPNPALAPIS